jgi:hypothetical protein
MQVTSATAAVLMSGSAASGPKLALPDNELGRLGETFLSETASLEDKAAAYHRFGQMNESGEFWSYSMADRVALSDAMSQSTFIRAANEAGSRFAKATAGAIGGNRDASKSMETVLSMFENLSREEQILVNAGSSSQTVDEWKTTIRVRAEVYRMEERATSGSIDPRLDKVRGFSNSLTSGNADKLNAWTKQLASFLWGGSDPVDVVELSVEAIARLKSA